MMSKKFERHWKLMQREFDYLTVLMPAIFAFEDGDLETCDRVLGGRLHEELKRFPREEDRQAMLQGYKLGVEAVFILTLKSLHPLLEISLHDGVAARVDAERIEKSTKEKSKRQKVIGGSFRLVVRACLEEFAISILDEGGDLPDNPPSGVDLAPKVHKVVSKLASEGEMPRLERIPSVSTIRCRRIGTKDERQRYWNEIKRRLKKKP